MASPYFTIGRILRTQAGDSSAVQPQLQGVQGLAAAKRSFVALLHSGSLVTWSRPNVSGINALVRAQIQEMWWRKSWRTRASNDLATFYGFELPVWKIILWGFDQVHVMGYERYRIFWGIEQTKNMRFGCVWNGNLPGKSWLAFGNLIFKEIIIIQLQSPILVSFCPVLFGV